MDRRTVLIAGASTGLASLAGCATLAPRLTSQALNAVHLDGAPGMTLGAVHRGRLIALGGAGRRGPTDPAVPGGDTVFEIGSLTKTFTASLIFELEAENRLETSTPIGHYLPDLPKEWQPATLNHLLSHTSGLPEYLDASNFRKLMPRDLAPRVMVDIAAAKPMMFEPGTAHTYNNTGYVLLGMVAEHVDGRSYWKQLADRFFRPTGMLRTGPRGRSPTDPDQAMGSFWDGTGWDTDPPVSAPGSTFSAGGLRSTAHDLCRWAQSIDRGSPFSAHTRDRMWRAATLKNGSPAGWGYGWKVEDDPNGNVVAHGGGTAGFSCWLRRDLTKELTTVVLTNQNGRSDPFKMTEELVFRLNLTMGG